MHVCVHTMSVTGVHRGKKRTLDLLELKLDSYQLPFGFWKLNMGRLFTTETSPSPMDPPTY